MSDAPSWLPWGIILAVIAAIAGWSGNPKAAFKKLAFAPIKLTLWLVGIVLGIYVVGGLAGLLLFGWKQF